MSCEENTSCTPSGTSIASALEAVGPRTVEGDLGRVTMPSVDEAIRALEYERGRCAMQSRPKIRSVLRTISGHRLAAHDGRAS